MLGPEMRSTGEVMGIDLTLGLAFAKSQIAAGDAAARVGHGLPVAGRSRQGRGHRGGPPLPRAGLRHRRHQRAPPSACELEGIEVAIDRGQARRGRRDRRGRADLSPARSQLVINTPTRPRPPSRRRTHPHGGRPARRAAAHHGRGRGWPRPTASRDWNTPHRSQVRSLQEFHRASAPISSCRIREPDGRGVDADRPSVGSVTTAGSGA